MTAPSVDTPTAVIRIGTRRSALAMAQATIVANALRASGSEVELVGVTTQGDRTSTALTESGGVGVFVTQLREELRARRVDVVVHSLKDLPTAPAPDLLVVAIPMREDARDALVARKDLGELTLATLPDGATVGTGSPRRVAQLRAVRPDLDIRPLRGNVDTRVGKVAAGELDAIVVAAAGLARLGRLDEATQLLSVDVMAPAPGQGALAIECRAADRGSQEPGGRLHELLAALDDPATRACVTAERGLLAALEAGCTAPVGAFADFRGTRGAASNLHLVAVVVSVDGVTAIRGSAEGPASDAEGIGRRLAAELLGEGAGALMGTRR